MSRGLTNLWFYFQGRHLSQRRAPVLRRLGHRALPCYCSWVSVKEKPVLAQLVYWMKSQWASSGRRFVGAGWGRERRWHEAGETTACVNVVDECDWTTDEHLASAENQRYLDNFREPALRYLLWCEAEAITFWKKMEYSVKLGIFFRWRGWP